MIRAALLLAAVLGCAAPASAATLGVFTFDYGPAGTTVGAGASNRAIDTFDLSSLAGAQIDSVALTLDYSGAGPVNGANRKRWRYEIAGNPDLSGRISRKLLRDSDAPLTLVFDAVTGGQVSQVFADMLATTSLSFGFDLRRGDASSEFTLVSASLTAFGSAAAVPIPAPGALLLAALGGLAWRRRTRAVPA